MDSSLPKKVVDRMKQQVGQLLGDDFLYDLSDLIPRTEPVVDIYRQGEELVVVAEIAGLQSADNVKITTNGRTLMIRGFKAYDYPVQEEELLLSERVKGAFQRRIELPDEVVTEGMKARYENGLLAIRLKVKPLEEEKPISVQFGGE